MIIGDFGGGYSSVELGSGKSTGLKVTDAERGLSIA